MSDEIFLVKDVDFFEIKCAIVVFQSGGSGLGVVGLSSSETGKAFTSDILEEAFIVNEDAKVINKENIQSALNGMYSDKCGLFLHGSLSVLIQYEAEYRKFILDTKKYTIKSRANKECTVPVKTEVVDLIVSAKDSLETNIAKSKRLEVEYLTLWPRYWGGYGEHFYIYAKSEPDLSKAINRIEKLCSARSIGFTELDSLELLPIE